MMASYLKIRSILPRSIRAKLLIVFLTLGALTGLLGAYGARQIHKVGLMTAGTFDRPLMALNYARSAQLGFEELLSSPLEVAHAEQSILDDLEVAKERSPSATSRALVADIQQLAGRWIKEQNTQTQILSAADVERRFNRQLTRQLRDAFERLSEQMVADGFVERREALAASAAALHSSMFATAGAVLFALLMTLMMSRIIVTPLTLAAAVARRIANGDFETPIHATGADEAAELLSSMAFMQDRLLAKRKLLQDQLRTITEAKEELRFAHDEAQKTASKLGEANDLLVMAGEMARIGYYHVDLRTREIHGSDELYRVHGITRTDSPITIEQMAATIAPEDQPKIQQHFTKVPSSNEDETYELRLIRPDGSERDIVIWTRFECAPDGLPVEAFGVVQDITERKQAEREQAILNERIRLATEAGGVAVWEWSVPGQSMQADERMADFFGRDLSLSGPVEWAQLLHPEDASHEIANFFDAIENRHAYDGEYRVLGPNGTIRHIRSRGTLLCDSAGQPDRMVGIAWDVTSQRLLAEQLHEEKERLQITLSSIGDAVVATDEASRITFMNPVAETLMGWKLEEVAGRPLREIFHLIYDDCSANVENPVERCLSSKEVVKLEDGVSLISRNGSRYAIQDSVGPVRTQGGEVVGAVLVFQDVSRAREMQRALAFNATHDALTGLANRVKFEADCQTTLDLVKRTHATHALCFVDLDRFKLVNDTAGHAAGDKLLKEIASLMKAKLRSTDIIARLGGDEFGLVLLNCPMNEARDICTDLIAAIADLRLPWEGKVYDVGASIGIAMISDGAPSLSEIMSQADVACYASKHGGRNRATLYDVNQTESGLRHREIFQASGLRNAIENNRFTLYAQDIISTATDHPAQPQIELLLRMLDEEGQIILPGALMPAVERFGLTMAIDRWVIEEALINRGSEIARRPDLKIAINISSGSLADSQFLKYLLSKIGESPIDPRAIQFELTETGLMSHLSNGTRFVSSLRDIGCTIALDDFGTGVSSFTYLRNCGADLIKMDGNFVRNVTGNSTDLAIVESINSLAHRLGIKTAAESVESMEVLQRLRDVGTDFAQGFAISQPAPLTLKLQEIDRLSERKLPGLTAA